MKDFLNLDPHSNAVLSKMAVGLVAAGTGGFTAFMAKSEPYLRYFGLWMTVIGALFTVIIGLPKVVGGIIQIVALVRKAVSRFRKKP